MARWVNLTTLQWTNNPNDIRKGVDRVREIWELLMDRAALDKPDIMLLPEYFMSNGMDLPVETVPGEGYIQEFLSRKAREYNSHIVAGMARIDPATSRKHNAGVLFDRQGNVAGIYDKMFPTPGEMRAGTMPGAKPCVFDTDFGRIGIAICFDVNFPELFAGLREQGAELCCFISAMTAAKHLPAIARDGRMFLASSAMDGYSCIINPIGMVLADSDNAGNARYVSARINLDFQIYHLVPPEMTEPFQVLLKRKYGNTVRMEHAVHEPWHVVYCDRDDMTAADIMREFGVETVDQTLNRTRAMCRELL